MQRAPRKRRYRKGNYSLEMGNLSVGNFQSTKPHRKWCINITHMRHLTGTIFLAEIKDVVSRMAMGYAAGKNPISELLICDLINASECVTQKSSTLFRSETGLRVRAPLQCGSAGSVHRIGRSCRALLRQSEDRNLLWEDQSRVAPHSIMENLMKRSMRQLLSIEKTSVTQLELKCGRAEESRWMNFSI